MPKSISELAAEITVAAIANAPHTLLGQEEDISLIYEAIFNKIKQLEKE